MPDSSLTDRLFDDADRAPLDPFALFEEWFAAAQETEPNDPHAMAVATVDADGRPDVRMVLMNARDQRGFVFFTNFESRKGEELKARPEAALVFHWKTQRRQVRVRGPVEIVGDAEADAYFASRSRGSRLASSVSRQSRPLSSRDALLAEFEALQSRLQDAPVPRPNHWSGFRVMPREIEFWRDGEFRLHDRIRFTRPAPDADWIRQRLYP